MKSNEEILQEYVAGRLESDELKYIEQELAKNPELQKQHTYYRHIWNGLQEVISEKRKEEFAHLHEIARTQPDSELGIILAKPEMEQKKSNSNDHSNPNNSFSGYGRIIGFAIAASILIFLAFWLRNYLSESPTTPPLEELLADGTSFTTIYDRSIRGNSVPNTEDSILAWRNSLFMKSNRRSYDTIVTQLEKGIIGDVNSPQILTVDSVSLAVAYYHKGEFEKCLQLIDEILPNRTYIDILLWYKGRAYIRLEENSQAIEVLCKLQQNHYYKREDVSTLLSYLNAGCP